MFHITQTLAVSTLHILIQYSAFVLGLVNISNRKFTGFSSQMTASFDNNSPSVAPSLLSARLSQFSQSRQGMTLPFVHTDTPDSGVSFGSEETRCEIPKPVTSGKSRGKVSAEFKKARGSLHTKVKASLRALSGPLACEFSGTAILYLIGFSGSLSAMVSPGTFPPALVWGIAVTFAMYWSMQFSGAHLNPGVSIMLATYGKFSWRKVLPYTLAQLLGAVLGTALAFCLQMQRLTAHLNELSPGTRPEHSRLVDFIMSSGVLHTRPNEHISPLIAFLNELAASFSLGFTIMVLDKIIPRRFSTMVMPPIMGAFIAVMAAGFGANTAACLSPIRDLAPRIVAAIVGGRKGWVVFTVGKKSVYGWWLWGPLGTDVFGIVVGAGCFLLRHKLCVWSAGQTPDREEGGKSGDLEEAGDRDREARKQAIVIMRGYAEQLEKLD